jgi:hypothetical protein
VVAGSILFWCLNLCGLPTLFSVRRFSEEKEAEAVMVVRHGGNIIGEILSQSQSLVKIVASDKLVVI